MYRLVLHIESDYLIGCVFDNNKSDIASDVVSMQGLDNGMVIDLPKFQNTICELIYKLESKLKTKFKQTYVLLPSDQVKTMFLSTQIKIKSSFSKEHITKMLNQLKSTCFKNKIYMIKQFPYSIQLDNREIKNPIGMEGNMCKITWSILYMQNSLINNFKKVFSNLYLQIIDYSLTDYEFINNLLEEDEKKLGAFAINVKNNTTIAYEFKNNIPISINNFEHGYNLIDKDIAVKFNLSIKESQKLRTKYCRGIANESDKNNHIKIYQRNIDEKIISHYEFIQNTIPSIKKLISQLVNNFEKHIKSNHRLFLIGKLAQISGIEFILKKYFDKNIHILHDTFNTSTQIKQNLSTIKTYINNIFIKKPKTSTLFKINQHISLWLKKIYDMIKK